MKRLFIKIAAVAAAASFAFAFSGCEVFDGLFGHSHNMEYFPTKAATCTEGGYEEYYRCTDCEEIFADRAGTRQLEQITITAPLGHSTEKADAVASTCSKEGNIEYYRCTRCGSAFADEAATLALTDVSVATIAHTYDEQVWKYDGSAHWHVCTECSRAVLSEAHEYDDNNVCTVCGYMRTDSALPVGSREDITSAELSIHFLELGNASTGDSILIKSGDTEVLVDAGSQQSSAATLKAYINEYCTDGTLEYVIATHADQDHIAGMVGTSSRGQYNGILYSYDIGTIIRFDRSNKDLLTSSGNPTLYNRFLTAVDAAVDGGAKSYTASQCWNETDGAQRTYYLDEEQSISLNILYNHYYENNSSDENNYSVCFLLTQELGNGEVNNYLFTGDLEEEGEEYLVENNALPEVELFKAGHHGSPTSSNDVLLSVIKPKNIAVCCCCGSDEYTSNKDNQFPSQAFISRAGVYTENIYVTTMVSDNEDGYESMNGDIVFYYIEENEAGALKLWCSNNNTKLKDTEWFAANRVWPSA